MIISKVISLLIFLLIFFMLFAAANLMNLKMIIVGMLVAISCICIIKNREKIKLSKGVIYWFIIYITTSVIYTLISIFNNNTGAKNFIGVNIINPIIFLLFIITISNSKYFNLIKKCIILSGLCIGIYNLIFTIVINTIPQLGYGIFPFISANEGGVNLGFTKFTSENITILTFLVPFVFAMLLIEKNKKNKHIAFVITILGVMSAILSARTAYILALGITPLIIMVLSYIGRENLKIKNRKIVNAILITVLILICIIIVFRIDFSLIIEKIKYSFNINDTMISNDNGGYIRAQQFKALIKTWSLKPIIGWGDGADAINLIRSGGGFYELSYIALLMQRGIIGFLIFFSQILWIYVQGIKIIRKDNELSELMFATLIGFSTILIANATNPYLYSFDRMIILFYPLAIINRSYVVNTKNKFI